MVILLLINLSKKIHSFSIVLSNVFLGAKIKDGSNYLKRLCLAEPAYPSRNNAARLMVKRDKAGETLKRKNERAIKQKAEFTKLRRFFTLIEPAENQDKNPLPAKGAKKIRCCTADPPTL